MKLFEPSSCFGILHSIFRLIKHTSLHLQTLPCADVAPGGSRADTQGTFEIACPSMVSPVELAHLSDSTIGMSGVAIPMGDTALCSKPVRLLDTSSGHNRILKALVPSAPPAALCAWYRWRFSFSACRRATYCSHELVHQSSA